MNQTELINEVATQTGLSKADTKRFFEAQADIVSKTLKKSKGESGEVSLPGLGKFRVKKRAARQARNPQTGETIKVPAKRVPAFSITKALKDVFVKK